jgi:hypothetical protein
MVAFIDCPMCISFILQETKSCWCHRSDHFNRSCLKTTIVNASFVTNIMMFFYGRYDMYSSSSIYPVDGINDQTRVCKEAYSSLNHQVKFDH